MVILLVINVIGLFVTLVNVLLLIETLNNEKEILKEHKNNLNYLDSINRELNSVASTVDHNNLDYLDKISHKLNSVASTVERNNLKYETQFNDIWHRIARNDEPLDQDEVNEQVKQYFNMLDNPDLTMSTTPVVKEESAQQVVKEAEHE